MYCLIKHPDQVLSTVISRQHLRFPDYIVKGYEVRFEGTKANCEAMQERMTAGIVSSMDDTFWGLIL